MEIVNAAEPQIHPVALEGVGESWMRAHLGVRRHAFAIKERVVRSTERRLWHRSKRIEVDLRHGELTKVFELSGGKTSQHPCIGRAQRLGVRKAIKEQHSSEKIKGDPP